MRRTRTALLAALTALTLTACGPGGSDTAEDQPADPASASSASPSPSDTATSPTAAESPDEEATAEESADGDSSSPPGGLTPVSIGHPGSSNPRWDLTAQDPTAGSYEFRSTEDTCLMRVILTQVPGVEEAFDSEGEATQEASERRSKVFGDVPFSRDEVPLGLADGTVQVQRYDATGVEEATGEPRQMVGLTRVFFEPDPTMWQSFYACAPEDFDEATFQQDMSLFAIVGDVEPELELPEGAGQS